MTDACPSEKKRRIARASAGFVLWAAGLAGLAAAVSLIPERTGGNPPVIDGTITAEEWQGARRESFSDGSELVLLRLGDELYLGIRAKTQDMIAANVFIESADGIAIHHASAALGTAAYERDGDVWRLVRNFTWRCRGAGDGEETRAERDAFLREEGWIASTSWMGNPHELEYRIRTGPAALRLAVVFLRASVPNAKTPWPAVLDDDCIKPTPKGLPPALSFAPEKWATIAPGNVTRPSEIALSR